MFNKLFIYVAGDPVGQPRARCIALPGGKVKLISTADKKKSAYKKQLIALMKREAKRQGWEAPALAACFVLAYFGTKHKDRWGRYCGKKPDRDNIDKLILDCAGEKKGAGIIKDDAKIVEGGVRKMWGNKGAVLIEFRAYPKDACPVDVEIDDIGADSG